MFLCLSLSIDFLSAPPGNTVIHLDKALARMREYERMKLRAECNTDNPEHSPGAAAAAATALSQGTAVNTLRLQIRPNILLQVLLTVSLPDSMQQVSIRNQYNDTFDHRNQTASK